MTEIRHKDGVPTIADFHSTKGPPIVVDTTTGTIYTVDENDTVAAQGGTVEDGSITTAKLGGDITTAGKALLDDANAAAQLTTLGAAAASHAHAAGDITSGTMATARLGSGSATSGTYLRGDQTWASPPGGSEAFPIGAVFIAVVNTDPATLLGYGTWSAFGAGRVLVGRDAGDTDFDTAEETGGAKTVASTGTNAGEATHTHSVTSNVTVADHASHTHTYTEIVQHTHTITITDPGHAHTQTTSATDGASGRADASSGGTVYNNVANINSNTTGITASSANPAGSVATGTTAGPNATLTHSVTNNAVTSGAGASHTHTYTGNATSVVQPYIVVYMWKRTA